MQKELIFPPVGQNLVETPEVGIDTMTTTSVTTPVFKSKAIQAWKINVPHGQVHTVITKADWLGFDAGTGYSRGNREALWGALCRLLDVSEPLRFQLRLGDVISPRVMGLDGQGWLLSQPGVTPVAIRLLARFLYVKAHCRMQPDGAPTLWPVRRPSKRVLKARAG